MNSIVISNVHREPIITPYIGHMNPVRSLTPDYPHPQIGHIRCFQGHTNALRAYMTDETACVFEDDCRPYGDCPWEDAIRAADGLVLSEKLDFVCLHGRGFEFGLFDTFKHSGFEWMRPNAEHQWVLGTLVYVASVSGAKKFTDVEYWCGGCNIDLFMWSRRHNWVMIDPRQFVTGHSEQQMAEQPRPFAHDRCQGSLIENGRNVQHVYR